VKHLILNLWVLSLLGSVALVLWTLSAEVTGSIVISWIALSMWLAVLTFWSLLTYMWFEICMINMGLWVFGLLLYASDGAVTVFVDWLRSCQSGRRAVA